MKRTRIGSYGLLAVALASSLSIACQPPTPVWSEPAYQQSGDESERADGTEYDDPPVEHRSHSGRGSVGAALGIGIPVTLIAVGAVLVWGIGQAARGAAEFAGAAHSGGLWGP